MSSQFYKRYIPPKTADPVSNSTALVHIAPESTIPKPTKESKERKREKKRKTEEVHNEDELPSEKRHEALFAKFNKSTRISQRLKQLTVPETKPEIKKSENETSLELHDLVPIPQPEPVPEVEYKPTFSSLPPWLSKPITVSSDNRIKFSELRISHEMLSNLQRNNYSESFPVQSKLIPLMIFGPEKHEGDICVSAPTGSGKTLAYSIPILSAATKPSMDTRLKTIIVVPTRELVTQARQVLTMAATGLKIKIGVAFGSNVLKNEQDQLVGKFQIYDPVKYKELVDEFEMRLQTGFLQDDSLFDDVRLLRKDHIYSYTSKIDILICTPGRLVEHIQSTKGFSLQHLQHLIIDEADKLLDDNFQEWVHTILSTFETHITHNVIFRVLSKSPLTKQRPKLQKVILSATMTKDLAKLASLNLRNPLLLVVMPDMDSTKSKQEIDSNSVERVQLPESLSEIAIPVKDGAEKPLYLYFILRDLLSDSNSNAIQARVLIFVNSNEDALRLEHMLGVLHPPLQRNLQTLTKIASKEARKALSNFKSGKFNVLIASDRASRGLDITDLSDVINYDMPRSIQDYIHRSGRTARANKSGTVWTLFTNSEGRWFWNDIARSKTIYRGQKKVERRNLSLDSDQNLREKYITALESLKEAVNNGHAKSKR